MRDRNFGCKAMCNTAFPGRNEAVLAQDEVMKKLSYAIDDKWIFGKSGRQRLFDKEIF
jgi:hypothetical protein